MKTLKVFLALLFLLMTSNLMGFGWGGKKTLKELVDSTPLIVMGKVQEVNSQLEKYLGQNDFIFTYVKIFVQTSFKGTNSGQILTIKVPGGQIGDRVIAGERSFRFSKDEEALLFLTPVDQNYYEIYSISGKLSVVKKEDGEYVNSSMLKEDEVSKYGYGSNVKVENIISRINGYLAEKGGKANETAK